MKVFRIFLIIAACLVFGAGESFAQCGADGTQPCEKVKPTTKNTTPKKKTTVKPTVAKPKTTAKTPTKTAVKTPTRQACAPPTNNNDAPDNLTQTVNGVKFEMVGIPSGSFCMGSNDGEDDEKPVRRVTISKSFWMGKTEVTQAQWKAVMGNNPSYLKNFGVNCPVESVSWLDAQDFIRKLNKQGAGTYRLPTEAEWEYAARAGTTTNFSFGDSDSLSEDYAWSSKNAGSRTHEVASKQPNDWGLYDMHGNVSEWCQDWYKNYQGAAVTDPIAAVGDSFRVQRGGSWSYGASSMRSAVRNGFPPADNSLFIGFRLVRTQ